MEQEQTISLQELLSSIEKTPFSHHHDYACRCCH